MAKRKADPLSGLARSLDAEAAAVERRFNDAERFTVRSNRSRVSARGGTVRGTFSFPRDDHRLIGALQRRCYAAGFAARARLVPAVPAWATTPILLSGLGGRAAVRGKGRRLGL